MPKINVTVFNRTPDPLVCAFNNSNGTSIPAGNSLPIGWPGPTGGWWIAIPSSGVPNQITVTNVGGNVQVKNSQKTLNYPLTNDQADLWIDVYPGYDFWIRTAEIPFANYPVNITIKAPAMASLPDISGQGVDADFEVQGQGDRPSGHKVEKSVDPITGKKKIVVKNGPGEVDLCFKISAQDTTYRPMAMFVKRTTGNDPGWDAFDDYRIDGNTITIRDRFPPTKIGASYKYYLVVQRQDGAICIIDPEIENSSLD